MTTEAERLRDDLAHNLRCAWALLDAYTGDAASRRHHAPDCPCD
jgi:hypothetical protein